MKLLDIVTAPWAIQPEKLVEIRGIYATHLRGEKIDLKAVEAALGRPLNNQPKGYEVIDGVAVLPIEGVIAKRMSLLTQISGGTSSNLALRDFKQAVADPGVRAIILQIDSPGGAVDGTPELANAIFEARGTKPIVAFADGLMASAAYWIGSAAEKVYMSSDVTMVGSIGVVATHVDVSKAEEMEGYKTTEITAGKFKRIASEYSPLTPEGRASIQERVDAIYAVFLNDVAKFRGVDSAEFVHERMADGRIFTGRRAMEVGLVDGVSTMTELIGQLSQGGGSVLSGKQAQVAVFHAEAEQSEETVAGAATEPKPQEENHMNIDQLKADHPDLYQAVCAEAEAKGKEAGATAERERIQGVLAQALPGHEDLVKGLAFDGKTSPEQAAMAVLTAEREKKGKVLTGLRSDAPAPVSPAPLEEGSDSNPEAALKKEWDGSDSVRALYGTFENFVKARASAADAEKSGRVRIFRKS